MSDDPINRFDLHVFVHFDSGSADRKLDQLLAQGEQIMAVNAELQAILKRIDDATTMISTRIMQLIEQIGTGMSAEDVKTVTEALRNEATRLEVMGHNPDEPVPPV